MSRPDRRGIAMVVFFTRGMSLEKWHEAGILERELALYRELRPGLDRLAFVTYGGPNDAQWLSGLAGVAGLTGVAGMAGVEVLPNRWKLPGNLYSICAPWLHRKKLAQASLFRTNQINGAWTAVIAKRLFRKPLVVRGGFLWADFVSRMSNSRWRAALARRTERMVLAAADRIVVAGDEDAAAVRREYGVDAGRVTVVPNYVDTTRFRPLSVVAPEPGRLLFVGRLEEQKNPLALVRALGDLPDLKLTIVGEGSLRDALAREARDLHVNVTFLGRVDNRDLPELINRAQAFVLPSHYEGNPKSLIEAMACGVAVIGARVPGIENIVADGANGVLCGTAPEEIRDAIRRVLRDAPLRARIRAGALKYVEERCSLQVAVERERLLLASFGAGA